MKYLNLAKHIWRRFYGAYFSRLPIPREDWEAEARAMAWEAEANRLDPKAAGKMFSREWYRVLRAWGGRKAKFPRPGGGFRYAWVPETLIGIDDLPEMRERVHAPAWG